MFYYRPTCLIVSFLLYPNFSPIFCSGESLNITDIISLWFAKFWLGDVLYSATFLWKPSECVLLCQLSFIFASTNLHISTANFPQTFLFSKSLLPLEMWLTRECVNESWACFQRKLLLPLFAFCFCFWALIRTKMLLKVFNFSAVFVIFSILSKMKFYFLSTNDTWLW